MEAEYLILNNYVLNMQYAEALDFLETLGDDLKKSILSAYFSYKTIQYFKSLSKLREIGDQHKYKVFTMIIKALSYFAIGDKKYLELIPELERIVEQCRPPDYIYQNYLQLQIRRYSIENPKISLEIISKALTIAEKLQDSRMIVGLYGDKGVIYRMLGLYQEAESAFKKQLELLDGIDNSYLRFILYANLAFIMFYQKRRKRSLENIIEAIKYKDFIDELVLAQLYFLKMYNHLLQNEQDVAKVAYDEVRNLLETIHLSDAVKSLQWLSNAIWYKYKPRLRNTVLAQSYLEKIVYSDVINYELYFIAVMNLIDILVSEYSHFGEPEILDEISKLDEKLEKFCSSCTNGFFFVTTHQLRARLLFFRKDIKSAIDILNEGINSTKNKDTISELEKLKMKFLKQLNEWKNITSSNKEILDRMAKIEIREYLAQVVKFVGKVQ